ncbi:MAG: HAD hydrolase family protein [Clostridiales bacterium]
MYSSKLKRIKYLLFDLHGVILQNDSSVENIESLERILALLKTDIQLASGLNVPLGVISASEDESLLKQLYATGIKEIYSHSIDKVSQAEILIKKHNLSFEEIAFIGDDILDLPLLTKVGFSATTSNARREVKRAVDYICKIKGTNSVISDILTMIEKAKNS